MSKGVKIGKAGINPTIPLCPYCGEPKNEILLTGMAGEEAAKKAGYTDGQMPMYSHIQGDIDPCEKCREQGIAVVELDSNKKLTGNRWLIKEEVLLADILDEEVKQRVRETRIVAVPEDVTKAWGLRDND